MLPMRPRSLLGDCAYGEAPSKGWGSWCLTSRALISPLSCRTSSSAALTRRLASPARLQPRRPGVVRQAAAG